MHTLQIREHFDSSKQVGIKYYIQSENFKLSRNEARGWGGGHHIKTIELSMVRLHPTLLFASFNLQLSPGESIFYSNYV